MLTNQYNSSSLKLRVVSRSSNLALKQVEEVAAMFPGLHFLVLPIQSLGDKNKHISLIGNPVQDFFTRELDQALLRGDADIAVHSAKDLPYPLPEGLEVIALFDAFDQTDSLVSRGNVKLNELPTNPRLGTSSLQRKAELLKLRPDVEIVSIRGTIEERIRQADEGFVDAVIVATCALKRLGLEYRIAEVLPFETHPLQGHLAIVARKGNADIINLLKTNYNPEDETVMRRSQETTPSQLHKTIIRSDERSLLTTLNRGKVWLVGFGPGDPELLTRKGERLLNEADIIFHDDLIDKDFLNRFSAEKVYVGKRKNQHSHEQADINRLLYDAASAGKTVVRLKGGDPMLFAHGGEELEYLHRHLVEAEAVPGITTALAASSLTGVPLTHRGISKSVTLITAHSEDDIHVPKSGTLVYYMGASNASAIARKAIAKGWLPETPVLMVYHVSAPDQEEYYSTLQQLSDVPQKYKTPLIIIIGEVVGLKNQTAETLRKPVFLVTGTSTDNFSQFGKVVHTPFIEIRPREDAKDIVPVLKNMQPYQWLIFTSRYTVQYFFGYLNRLGYDSRTLSGIKIASVGKTTSAELQKHGIVPDLQPVNESSEGLIALFRELGITRQSILIPRSNLGLRVLPEGLTNAGNSVTTLPIYNTVLPDNISLFDPGEVDYVVFSSPSCVVNFTTRYSLTAFANHTFIVQGIETFKKLKEYGVDDSKIVLKEVFEQSFKINKNISYEQIPTFA